MENKMVLSENISDEAIQAIMKDILLGLKAKMVQPVLDESKRLAASVRELKELQQTDFAELKRKITELEAKVEQSPIMVLGAIRDAINQTGGEG